MQYMSDRQRVELMLLPALAYGVVKAGSHEPDSEVSKEACELFQNAVSEAIRLTDAKKMRNLRNRTCRIVEEFIEPYVKEGGRVDKMGLMLYNILNWSINSGYLVLHDGTAMAKGLDLLLPGLEHAANQAKLNASAQKAAKKMLKALQTHGYFEGVSINAE